jgi:hypothetical protein
MKSRWTSILMTILLPMGLCAQNFTKVGTSAAQFLKIPVGAKAASMGNAFASVADNATAVYWNPAGIAGLDRMQGSLAHSSWIAGLTHDFIGVVIPVGDRSSVGISGIALQCEKIEQTTVESPEGTGTYFDALDMALGITYARAMTDYVDIGATVKYVSQRIWSESAQTFAVDFGALLRTGFKDMKLGLSFQNFGPGMKMSGREMIRQLDQDPASSANPYVEAVLQTQEWDLPTSYRLSTSMSFIGENGMFQFGDSRLLIALDAIHPNDSPEHFSVGGDYEFLGTFAIRGGYVFNTDEEGLTLGAGLKIPVGETSLVFDYAYAEFGLLGYVQHFTLSASF